VVDRVFDDDAARAFGLGVGSVAVMIHSGSRGFGYQVCDEHVHSLVKTARHYQIDLPDRQLACAPVHSPEGQRYLAAMRCAANYAWANRQVLLHRARETFMRVLNLGPRDLDLRLVYDICHNIAKRETHLVNGKEQVLCVHRKGATRAFPPGHADLCDAYRDTGQPILIPGDMGTASYVMAGTQKAMQETFGSTCHGAGRVLSRTAARKAAKGRTLHRELADKGIEVRWTGRSTLAEEMPEAYKDIDQVVDVVAGAGISEKVARIRPIAVIKG